MESNVRQSQWFVAVLLLGTLSGSLVLPSVNLTIDRFRVLGGDIAHTWQYRKDHHENPPFEPNERYMRMKYVEANRDRYDSFVFGSSRVKYLDTGKLGENWYKLNYSAGMPEDHLRHLKVLLDQGVGISEVAIGLDRFAFYMPYPPGSIQFKAVPGSSMETLAFYYEYLWRRLNAQDWDILRGKAELAKSDYAVGYGPVRWSEAQTGRFRTNSEREAKLLSLPVFSRTLTETSPRIDSTLAAISGLVDLCRRENIPLTLYMNPFHYKNYLAMNHDELDGIFEGLAALSPFYDFSGLNEYTTDNAYWFETSHFTPPLNDLVIGAIRKGPELRTDYPVLVTPENVNAHRRRQRLEIYRRLPALLRYDHNIQVHPSLLKLVTEWRGAGEIGSVFSSPHNITPVPSGESLGLKIDGDSPRVSLHLGVEKDRGPYVLTVTAGAHKPASFAVKVTQDIDGGSPESTEIYQGRLKQGRTTVSIPIGELSPTDELSLTFEPGSNYLLMHSLSLYRIPLPDEHDGKRDDTP